VDDNVVNETEDVIPTRKWNTLVKVGATQYMLSEVDRYVVASSSLLSMSDFTIELRNYGEVSRESCGNGLTIAALISVIYRTFSKSPLLG
jgi:hypothetical protein